MNIRCLLGHHDWKFAYNHGMPLGVSTNDALKMFDDNSTYAVYQCTRCPKQAQLVRDEMIVLPKVKMELP